MDCRQEKLLQQVLAGVIECDCAGRTYYISSAKPILKLQAQNVYERTYEECRLDGMPTDEEVILTMTAAGVWTFEENQEFNSLNLIIDNIKVDMFNKYAAFQSKQVERLRATLNKNRKRYAELFAKRHSNDYYTCEGQAILEKTRFLICNSIYFNEEKISANALDDWIISKIVEIYMSNKPSEGDIRQLSNYDGWRSIWTCNKIGEVFGVPAVLLTDEQKSLVGWSKLYDNIAEHPESPSKEVINDDDLLDGWLIIQQSKTQNKEVNVGSGEIYIPAETKEDAARIYSKNSMDSRLVQKQRLGMIKKRGVVGEENMPDSKLQMIEKAREEFFQKKKG